MSKVIYADLVYAQTVSWSFWTSMDVESHGYKNRYNLLRLETPDADIPSIVKGGKVTDVKTLWVLGHYSRFVRPGYIRVDVRNCDDLRGVFGSAYISDDGKRVVAVLNNMSNEVVKIPVTLKGIAAGKRIKRCDMYVTDNDMDMKLKNDLLNDNGVLLLPKSVNTIVYIL